MRHMLIASLVVILVNAQLCWWVVYVLRENRQRLKNERAELLELADRMRDRQLIVLFRAAGNVAAALADGQAPGASEVPSPFVSWRIEGECQGGWSDDGEVLEYGFPTGSGCVLARSSAELRTALLEAPAGVEVVSADRDDALLSGQEELFILAGPFDDLVARPSAELWDELLSGYQRRIKMMVSEATFFGVLLLVVVAMLWKTVRREVELERQHRNFLSAITHELKSPLASMRLSLETVLRGRADGKASEHFLRNALQDTERLQSLVQKVLEVTRFGAEERRVTLQRKDLSEVVESALEIFSRRATSVGARLDKEIARNIYAELDEEAFVIAVSNLLENAVKYGGAIPHVKVRLMADNERAVLDVCDNGCGVAEEEIPFVFNRFFRGGDEMTRTAQGTGLGLYIVRQILDAHSGSVEVHRTGPEGSTFRLTLPRAELWENEA